MGHPLPFCFSLDAFSIWISVLLECLLQYSYFYPNVDMYYSYRDYCDYLALDCPLLLIEAL